MSRLDVFQAGAGLVGLLTEQQQRNELIRKDEERFAEGKSLLQTQLGKLPLQSRQLTNQVTSGFGQLRNRVLGDIRQVGGQERKDINARFTGAQSRATQDLTARGLGSSTILSGVGSGIERQRSGALGSLADRLRIARASADERITGSRLGARAMLGSQAIGLEANLGQFLANAILGRSDIQPFNIGTGAFQAAEFFRPAPQPEQPKDTSLLTAGIGGGSLVGAAAIM